MASLSIKQQAAENASSGWKTTEWKINYEQNIHGPLAGSLASGRKRDRGSESMQRYRDSSPRVAAIS
jgi:hypothetical protein